MFFIRTRLHYKISNFLATALLLMSFTSSGWAIKAPTIVVSAEGLADPNFYKDRTMAYDEAFRDAKAQAVEKAVGCFVSSQTVVQNYTMVRDLFVSKTEGLIKRIIKVVNAGVLNDGFYHVWIKAEVYAQPLRQTVRQLSRSERVAIIRSHENPIISVGMNIISPSSGGLIRECMICDTEIRDRLRRFGYKVISEKQATSVQVQQIKMLVSKGFSRDIVSMFVRKASDISVTGTIKLKKSPVVEIGGIKVQTTLLTAWSLEATDNHTSEIIFARNFRPAQGEMYNDEDEAIMKVGDRIGRIFSRDLFRDYVLRPSHSVLLTVSGIQDRRVAKQFKKDLLGIRAVLNVTFREFLSGGETVFEVEFAGTREYLADILDSVIIQALDRKYGPGAFRIQEEHGDVLRIAVDQDRLRAPFSKVLDQGVPIQLVNNVAPQRLQQVVKSKKLKAAVVRVNKDALQALNDL